jgi:hypothetical protein
MGTSNVLSLLFGDHSFRRTYISSHSFCPIRFVPLHFVLCEYVRVEGEGEGATKCNGTKRMGENEWDEMIGRPSIHMFAYKYYILLP